MAVVGRTGRMSWTSAWSFQCKLCRGRPPLCRFELTQFSEGFDQNWLSSVKALIRTDSLQWMFWPELTHFSESLWSELTQFIEGSDQNWLNSVKHFDQNWLNSVKTFDQNWLSSGKALVRTDSVQWRLWSEPTQFSKALWLRTDSVQWRLWSELTHFTEALWSELTQLSETLWSELTQFSEALWSELTELTQFSEEL